MNQVPWRRILERAGDEESGERGASVINLRDHAPDRQQNHRRPPAPPPSDLESELKRALDRAQHTERQHNTVRPAPQRRENPGARMRDMEARSAPMLRPDLAMQQRQNALPVPPPLQPKTASGTRNFLAISLSAAVIGFAVYQVSDQWKEMNAGPEAGRSAADVRESSATTLAGVAPRNTTATPDEQRPEFAGNRIDLRPSLAGEAGSTRGGTDTRQSALDRDIAEAAKLIANADPRQNIAPAATAPATADAVPSEESMEQTMLRRGHDMVRQRRVESARLVFEHLAEQKSALGAFALAQTYDSRFLRERGITEVAGNEKLAADWYERAAELTMNAGR